MKPLFFTILAVLIAFSAKADDAETVSLRYEPAPADNPLKGLVPYAGERRDKFPHSLEFNYLPLSKLMTGYDTFNWQPLEDLLNDIAGRNHQAVFRIWMEYPDHKDGIPKFLEDDGLKVTEWLYTETQPFPPAPIRTPDYADLKLRRALNNFIAAMGKKYDGDARIGFITAGLLGTWGEWHNYPRTELMAPKAVQLEVMAAYENAFRTTPVLLRYPAGPNSFHYADNSKRRFGYHDDSFAWATLDTGREEDNWYFVPAMKAAGPEVVNRWKLQPIGGEIRPEIWGQVFDASADTSKSPTPNSGQNFRECVQTTHASWLLDSGMFQEKQSPKRIANATKAVQQMGYEFHVSSVSLQQQADQLKLTLKVKNTGVAPFYYNWPVEVAVWSGEKRGPQNIKKTNWPVTGLLPGKLRIWETTLAAKPDYSIAIRIVNPLKNGLPLRFANEKERQLKGGWLRVSD